MKNCKTFYILFLVLVFFSSTQAAEKKVELVSPNKEIKVSLRITDKIYYSISYNGDAILKDNYLRLTLRDEVLGENPKLSGQKFSDADEMLSPVIPLKFSTVRNHYNQLRMDFKGNYSVEFRAYDDGIAYRFLTNKKGDIEVMNEDLAINFPAPYLLHMQQPGSFKTAYEENYTHVNSNEWTPEDKKAVLPLLIDTRLDFHFSE